MTCRTQEVHVYRNAKTNKLAAGMEDKVQLVTYAIGITRIAEDVNNPETRGWRLIEMQKSGRDYLNNMYPYGRRVRDSLRGLSRHLASTAGFFIHCVLLSQNCIIRHPGSCRPRLRGVLGLCDGIEQRSRRLDAFPRSTPLSWGPWTGVS